MKDILSLVRSRFLETCWHLQSYRHSKACLEHVSYLRNLEELILYGNQIKNISALSKLCKLRVLKLEGNLIEDVEPLLNLKNLEKLSLGDNPVKNVQLLENLTGTDIDLE